MIPFFILAVIPALYWIWLFYIGNKYKRSNIKLMVWLFIGGFFCGFLALTLNHVIEKYTFFWSEAPELSTFFGLLPPFPAHRLGFWLMIGFNEELSKLLVVLLLAYSSKDFKEPYDGMLYMAIVALGFATIENAIYVERYSISVLVIRVIVTLPIHIFISMPMGYYLSRARMTTEKLRSPQQIPWHSVRLILIGWMIAALLHATYDILLSINQKELAYLQLFLMGGMTWFLRKHCLNLSRYSPHNTLSNSG